MSGVVVTTIIGGVAGWRAAGTKGAGKDFSHWIPNRWGGPRSKWNGNFVPVIEHALSDPFRYQFMKKTWKEANKMPHFLIQQWVRIPKVYKGIIAGNMYGNATSFSENECICH